MKKHGSHGSVKEALGSDNQIIVIKRMGLKQRPSSVPQKQAVAAVGQVHLMRCYEDLLHALGLTCAQVLLTLENLANRSQYINARNTFTELLAYGAVPIVNENDTVAVQNLRFGDNDTLSAQVATLVGADWLFLLTDVDCLYTDNPKHNPHAEPIPEVHDIADLHIDTSTNGTQWGTGGMATKLTAARLATAGGCRMVICNSNVPENIVCILGGERIGTLFHPLQHQLRGRKRWIISVPLRGSIWLDDGAVAAVLEQHKSLFSVGIISVHGSFHAQDAVALCDSSGSEFARGLVNFTADEVRSIMGAHSDEIRSLLGYEAGGEVVHRENLALLACGHHDCDVLVHECSAEGIVKQKGASSSMSLQQQNGCNAQLVVA